MNVSFNGGHRGDRQKPKSSTTATEEDSTLSQGDRIDRTDFNTQSLLPATTTTTSSSPSPKRISPKSSLTSHHSVSFSIIEPLENVDEIRTQQPKKYDRNRKSNMISDKNPTKQIPSPSSSSSQVAPPPDPPPFPPPPPPLPLPPLLSLTLPLDKMPGLGGSSGSVKSEKSSPNMPYKLSTINERIGKGEEQEETPNDNIGGERSDHPKESKSKPRTSSSGNLPDFLSQKLHHQMNITSNFLRSKRKSIAVSTMLRDTTITNPVRMVKESYDSSTSTTTSESYHLNDLPTKNLPVKLATLNKPQMPMFNSSFRRARHSIDVRALPSYLAKKRQSTFGQLLSVINPTAPDENGSSSDGSLFAEPIAPTLSLGERVAWIRESGPEFGVVKWIGRMPQISNDWVVGVEFDNAIGSGDGTVDGRRYFVAKENFAKFLPITDLTKVDHYAGRPRSGTMLSRMSVQLKPGQLISIQRSPTTTVPHCYLNAPHHVGHDVHSPNNRHCQCHSCNHPCAHICKTRKPKGKRWTEDMAHMCHFSSKPHASMCCGGEDLATACEPLKEPGTSWKHSEVIASLRTVPTEMSRQRKTTLHSITMHSSLREPPPLQSSSLMMMMKKPSSKMDVQRESSSPNFDDDLLDRHQQLGSGLLARTGSDLSISSLPSSSSVAEMYIGRSVLTDESDIDSETEKSLESNSKVRNKQGLRSLVACFLANSLRLKSIKLDNNSNSDQGNNKKTNSDRSHSRRVVSGGKHLQHHHHHHHHHHHNSVQQPQSQYHLEKKKQRKAAAATRHNNRLGLSSTDTSYHADIPSSSVAANPTQPFNSLSSDLSHHPMIMMMNEMNPTIQSTTLNSNPNFSNNNHKNRSITSNSNKKPMQNLASSSYYSYGSKSSPYRNSEMQMLMDQHHQQHPTTSQHHQIDGHISEEITYTTTTTTSSSSGAQKFTRAESAVSDKRSMNYATSSETFQSPRRRRNKGPAPKPPKKSTNNNNKDCGGVPPRTTTGCSSSPMSNVDPVSTASLNSFPASLSNSSLTTNASSNAKAKVILTKSPAQHPPNLVRSLSEQKNINTKILINAMPSFRSEVNLQEVIDGTQKDTINQIKENEEELIAIVCNGNRENVEPQSSLSSGNPLQQYPEESIYETPLSGKVLLLKEIPPFLPEKTFDPVKVFGCPLNVETKLLESRSCHDDNDDHQPQSTRQSGGQHSSPGIIRSKSMPFAKYTCCMYHWKEYLSTLSDNKLNENDHIPSFPTQDACRIDFCDALLDDVCDCNRNNGDGIIISNLTNALLSPKHSLRFKKSDFDLKISSEQTNGGGEGGASNGNSPADNLLNEMNSFEFIRAMSDGSLTNTNSAATVVEYINDEQNDGLKSREEILAHNAQLKDVFCQTSFKLDSPEKLSRNRCCKHKHCRCRSLRYRTHRKDCRYLYSCTLHNDCHANNSSCFQSSENKKCSNVWLTSSTSDHSLSSLSSSNSTLSETTSAMRNVNDLITFSNKNPLPMSFWTSTKPCGDNMNNSNHSNHKRDDHSSIDRSSISTEKLFKSAQKNHSNHHHNQKSGNNQNQMFPIKPDCFITQTGNGSFLVGSKKPAELNENISVDSFDDIPNEFDKTKTDYVWSRCLMSQLEMAIANGDHQKAAMLAKELAFKKVNCSLTGKFSGNPTTNASVSGTSDLISCDSPIVTYLYIEDRLSHRGPIPFQLYPSMTVDMLKIKVEKDFNIPSEFQQWIFGKSIATNMDSALFTYGITSSGCPIFLHIKTPNVDEAKFPNPIGKSHETIGSETNGDLFEKDDDSIFETLQPSMALPPYSSNIKDHVSLINEAKINNPNTFNNTSNISYIQNPLASLDLDSMNSISRTSFNNLTQSNGSENFSNNPNPIKNFNFPEEEPQQSYKTELVFESLNFVNEMLPRVEEENEDELEEYNDDGEDEDEENSQNSEQIRSFKPISKVIGHREEHAKLIDIDAIISDNDTAEQFDCPICLCRFESDQRVMLKGCRHNFCRACLQNTIEFSVEVPIKCPCCDYVLGDDEIKESASAETYERYLSRSISEAEKKFNKTLSNQCPNSTLEFPGKGNL